METTIRGGQAPALIVSLGAGEELVSEPGAMMFMSGDVTMDTELTGGLAGGLRRAVAGESAFLVRYRAAGSGAVGLCGPYPGTIREHQLDGEVICERHAYLCHTGELTIEPVLSARKGMGLLGGGEGFVLQKLSGKGTVWLHGGGDFVDFDLADGQRLVVDTGCMVMVEPTVRYEVKRQGLGRSLAAGEGLFLVHMTGPGHVTLQTLPFSRIAERTREASHGGAGEKGGLLGNLMGG